MAKVRNILVAILCILTSTVFLYLTAELLWLAGFGAFAPLHYWGVGPHGINAKFSALLAVICILSLLRLLPPVRKPGQ